MKLRSNNLMISFVVCLRHYHHYHWHCSRQRMNEWIEEKKKISHLRCISMFFYFIYCLVYEQKKKCVIMNYIKDIFVEFGRTQISTVASGFVSLWCLPPASPNLNRNKHFRYYYSGRHQTLYCTHPIHPSVQQIHKLLQWTSINRIFHVNYFDLKLIFICCTLATNSHWRVSGGE